MNAIVDQFRFDPAWSTAVPDWEKRIRDLQSLIPSLPLHDAYADKALKIFKALVVPDIEGHPTHGEVCEDWVFDFVRVIFGSYDPETKQRYLSEFFLLIPKKNGKTSIAAAIIVTACILNTMPNAELLLVAPTTIIAGISFKQAKGIVQMTPGIANLFYCKDHEKKILNLNPDIPSEISIKAADGDVVTGSKASYVLIDETHVFASRPAAKGVFVEIRGGLSKVNNKGVLIQITTQSKAAPQGVFREELALARAVRDGRIQYPMLALLYELPADLVENGGWKDPATWGMVNPNLNRSVSAKFLMEQLIRAEDDGPEALALLASQHFNVEIGTAQWGDGWSAARYWDNSEDASLTLDSLLERSEVATIGVDGGGEDDLLGLCVIGRERGTRRWLVWTRAWAQEIVLERRKSIAAVLQDFAKDGDLVICKDREAMEHVAEAAAICKTVFDSGLLPEQNGIGLDQAGLPELFEALVDLDLVHPLVVAVGQGWKLAPAIKSLPLRLRSKLMVHAAQPMMAWSVGNAKIEVRGNNPSITKQTAGTAKIDPVIALLNAAMLMFLNPNAGSAAYEYTGL